MSRIDRWISVLERIHYVNQIIMHIPLIPYYIADLIWLSIEGHRRQKQREREERQDPKYEIRQKLEAGEMRLCDVPHQHIEDSNIFAFYEIPDKPFYGYQFFYLAMEPDDRISRFFREEKEAIGRWTAWYGFEIVIVEDVDAFLSDMCFPQDKVYFKHGLLRNGGCTTADPEYWQNVRPFTYYELDADSPTPLLEQLYLIVQGILREHW